MIGLLEMKYAISTLLKKIKKACYYSTFPISFILAQMTYSQDIKWRAIILIEYYGMELKDISHVLGMSVHVIKKWNQQFKK